MEDHSSQRGLPPQPGPHGRGEGSPGSPTGGSLHAPQTPRSKDIRSPHHGIRYRGGEAQSLWPPAHQRASTKQQRSPLIKEDACRRPGAPATSSPLVLSGKPWLPQLLQLHQRPNVGPPQLGHCETQGASAEAHLQGRRPVSH